MLARPVPPAKARSRGAVPGGGWEYGLGQPPIDLLGGPGFPDSYYVAAAGAELAAAPDLGARPLVVLTHGLTDGLPDDFEALWVKWQKQVALLSSSSMLVRADTAGHAIQFDAPDLTAEAFRLVIAAVRNRAPLPSCSATRLPALNGTCLDPTRPGELGLPTRSRAAEGWRRFRAGNRLVAKEASS